MEWENEERHHRIFLEHDRSLDISETQELLHENTSATTDSNALRIDQDLVGFFKTEEGFDHFLILEENAKYVEHAEQSVHS